MRTVVVSAPGSLMLMGEHAVLHGRRALVCAVNRRLSVCATGRADGRVAVRSALGGAEAAMSAPDGLPDALRFVREAVRGGAPMLPGGCTLDIESDLPHTLGLGSSAAVTVAVVGAVRALAGAPPAPHDWIRAARAAIVAVQGRGSGADAAASVLGGLVAYRAEPFHAERLPGLFPLTVVYSGAKRPTAEVMEEQAVAQTAAPAFFEAVYDAMDAAAGAAEAAARADDGPGLGRWLNAGQGLMAALGVVDAPLAEIVARLRASPGILGAKVSGSGLGDCALGLGEAAWADLRHPRVDACMDARGAEWSDAEWSDA
jgi:mevalonate kinase